MNEREDPEPASRGGAHGTVRGGAHGTVRAGALLAVGAALAFGATTPLVQHEGRGVGPFATAALLYTGAAFVAALPPYSASGAPLRRSDAGRLLAVALLGALVAPAALAWGLQRTDGVSASLLLNLEALFTVILAWAVWHEPIGARVAAALAAMLAGGVGLVGSGVALSVHAGFGALAVAGATLAWAADNTVGRPLADRSTAQVVLAKSSVGAAASVALALATRESAPHWRAALALSACGAFGYGASLRLYLRAQRVIGAARTGSIFAAAPFVGAGLAWAMGQRAAGAPALGAAVLCALGVWLHLTEDHEHAHVHVAMEHEHAHRHDDGHHQHPHGGPPPEGEHSHWHRHDGVTHSHAHALDVHHRHRH
jgi:drug/metabolite transporter (DMT)-like permease